MKFSVSEDLEEVVKVSISGCLTQLDIAPPLDPFRQILGPNAYTRTVLLDMKESNYLDSMCIGWLLSAHKRFRENAGKLVGTSYGSKDDPLMHHLTSATMIDKTRQYAPK